MKNIPESDWKKLRSIQEGLLEKACSRVLVNLGALIDARLGGNHKTYLAIWKFIKDEDQKISDMFNDVKRSNAILKIAFMYKFNIIDDDILKEFSEETQNRVRSIVQID